VPALVVCGADDRLTPPRYSRYLHEQIRGSRLVMVEGAGHMVMLEQPQATNQALRDFLLRLDVGAGS
jgi:pimeloyl-ACP methyl ester carboxylesterase